MIYWSRSTLPCMTDNRRGTVMLGAVVTPSFHVRDRCSPLVPGADRHGPILVTSASFLQLAIDRGMETYVCTGNKADHHHTVVSILVSVGVGSCIKPTHNLSATSTDSTGGGRSVHQGVSRSQSISELGAIYRRDGFTILIGDIRSDGDKPIVVSTAESAGLTDMYERQPIHLQ